MVIKTANFVMSNQKVGTCPNSSLSEVAFIGRSNVGKSSLINMLCDNKKLAKTSGTPGKTQLINHFLINENWHLVDLPGYGYAKLSKKLRATFGTMISDYLTKRTQLINTFVLIDARLEPQTIDLDFIRFMGENGLPFSLVFTKADKLKPMELQRNVLNYEKELSKEWETLPPRFMTSSEKKLGREELLSYIGEIV